MAYMCENMRRTVVYDGDKISITLTRCFECMDCYDLKQEMKELWAYPRFAPAKAIIGCKRE